MKYIFVTSERQLALFDSDTEVTTTIGETQTNFTDVAYGADGTIYAITQDALYTIRASASGILREERLFSLPPNQGWNALDVSSETIYIAGRNTLAEFFLPLRIYTVIRSLPEPSGGDIVYEEGQAIVSLASGNIESYDVNNSSAIPRLVLASRSPVDAFAPGDGRFAIFLGDVLFQASQTPGAVYPPITIDDVKGTFTGAATVPITVPVFTVKTSGESGERTDSYPAMPYVGPAENIRWEFRGTPAAREEVTGTQVSDFINALAGDDVVFGLGGDDILDGGVASNFLEGGAGTDTFFLDARNGQVGWSTIVDFVPDVEQVSIWGYRPGVSRIFWEENYGASGYTGATAFIDVDGSSQTDRSGVDFAVTFTGHSVQGIGPRYEFDGLLWFRPAV